MAPQKIRSNYSTPLPGCRRRPRMLIITHKLRTISNRQYATCLTKLRTTVYGLPHEHTRQTRSSPPYSLLMVRGVDTYAPASIPPRIHGSITQSHSVSAHQLSRPCLMLTTRCGRRSKHPKTIIKPPSSTT